MYGGRRRPRCVLIRWAEFDKRRRPPSCAPLSLPAGAVALVDVRSRSWPVLYANDPFAREEGCHSVEEVTSSPGLWNLFEPQASRGGGAGEGNTGQAGRPAGGRRQHGACGWAAGCLLVSPAQRPHARPLAPPAPLFPQEKGLMAELDAAVAAGRPVRASLRSCMSGRTVSVVLRPGSSDQLQPSKVIGIPNWVPSEKAPQVGCHAGGWAGRVRRSAG